MTLPPHRAVGDANHTPDHNAIVDQINTLAGQVVMSTSLGVASGVATLDSNGKIPSTQLSSTNLPDLSATYILASRISGSTDLPGTLASASSAGASTKVARADHTHGGAVLSSQVGVANGLATLDGTTKVTFSQIPTGTTATSVALGNHTHATGTVVGTSDAQTLTNKTISGANNTITNLSITSVTGLNEIIPFSLPQGSVSVQTGSSRFYIDYPCTFVQVRFSVGTAPAGTSMIFDVKKNGTTIYTTTANRPTIAAGAFTGVSTNPDVTTFAAGDYVSIDVVQVGSTTPGSNLNGALRLARTA